MSEAAYRMDIGEYKCVILSDGSLVSEGTAFPEVFGLNCLYLESGNRRVLIDTGCGEMFQATTGRLPDSLAEAGIKPADINTIIFTHGHIDHVAGSFSRAGRPVFPVARYIVSAREWRYWEAGPGDNELQNFFFSPARKNLLPIKDRFYLAEDGTEVLPGIKLIPAAGHTPGIVTVDITSRGKRLFCIGDIIHSPREFIEPECLAAFDVTPAQALATRERVLADVAQSGTLVFACHFPFPGLGYIKRRKGVFTWQPV
jgi:glyoxylase-like metal-dependent hydrolase (beta-lactamase superfamily II)